MQPVINNLDFAEVENDPSLKYLFDNFLTYSSHIVQEKAIPSIADGLLPTQRRYVLAMAQLGCGSNSKVLKSTTIGSYVTGNLSPQGNAYSVLVGQSQYYRVPQMLFKPSGNFGEPEANAASADRYTESRLSVFAEKVFLHDFNGKPVVTVDDSEPRIVPYRNTFTNTHREPEYLPSRIPTLLINGNNGIGVSISQTWTPLNFKTYIEEYINYLQEKPIDYTRLRFGHPSMNMVISSQEDFICALKSGHGSVRLAPPFELVKSPRGKLLSIDVLACPPYTSLNGIGDSFNQWKIRDGIDCPFERYINNSFNDKDPVLGVNVTRVRLTFTLKTRNQTTDEATISRYICLLYSKVGLIQSYTVNMMALNLSRFPKEYDLQTYFEEWTSFRESTIQKMAAYNLKKVESQIHRHLLMFSIQKEFSKIKDVLQKCDGKELLFINIKSILQDSEHIQEELTSEDIEYILSLPLSSIARINYASLTDRYSRLLEEKIQYQSLINRKEVRIKYIMKESQEFLDNASRYGIRDIVNEFDSELAELLQQKSQNRPSVSSQFTFEQDELCNDIIISVSNDSFIRINTKSVKSAPFRLNIPEGEYILSAEYSHSSKLLFLTQQGRFLFVPSDRLEYGVPYSSSMISEFSSVNGNSDSKNLIFVASRCRKPKYLYLTDNIYFKNVNLKGLTYRTSVRMKGKIARALLIDRMFDSNGNIRNNMYEYKALRIGSLPKVYHVINQFSLYPSDRYKINIIQPDRINKEENPDIAKSTDILEI